MKSLLFALLIISPFAAQAQDLTLSGTMHRSSLEGGCWYLQGDRGKRYELVGDTGLVHALRIEGQHVVVNAAVVKNAASVCMIGEIVRVLRRIDTVRYALDLTVAPLMIDGTIHRTKSGVWYVKTSRGPEYEFQKPPKKEFRHIGALIHQTFRVLLDKHSTRTGKDGVILTIPAKPKAMQKKYDER